MKYIDVRFQYRKYKKEIDQRIKDVLDHGNFILGPEVSDLENILANYVGVEHCISVSSGTASLEIALRALNIGPGDEVITVPFSWISTVEVIAAVGARPILIDIEPDTYNMDVGLLEDAITSNTKAIIPVSLFGQMSKIEVINKIAAKYNIAVIEDGAQSFGATRNGMRSCGASLIGSTSFFPAKPLGCFGDGGALFTNDAELANVMRAIRSHGGIQRHVHTHIGMNGRMDTLQAAIILGKWPFFEKELISRTQIASRYNQLLKGSFSIPEIAEGNTHVYGQYTLRMSNEKRRHVLSLAKKYNIPLGIYYPKCIHEQPVFEYLGYQVGDFPVSEKASNEVLSLPMHPFLDMQNQDKIINMLTFADSSF